MRVPLSWLREYAALPAGVDGRALAERLVRAGLEVETVEPVGADLAGPLVLGRVLSFTEETHANGRTIRWCEVDVGEAAPRGIVCGARNFAVGDAVVVALPGTTLPGGFAIAARRTYGHVSDGMICSARELGLGEDHSGILVLPGEPAPGADAVAELGLRDEVLDIAVTPDRGYCLSVRGVAREAATAYGVPFTDPAAVDPAELRRFDGPDPHPAAIADPTACDRFLLRTVRGFDPAAPTPVRIWRRLLLAGMRPVSLAVDVTNYVLLETGQPLHAFDRGKLRGPVVVRRARPGERLETLDHVVRDLHPEDILITDDSGPISLAGTMGGLATEIDDTSTDLVLEAAHFAPTGTARMARRHRLGSEASRRFERGVDPELPPLASARAAALLVAHGGGTVVGTTDVALPRDRPVIRVPAGRAARVAGAPVSADTVVRQLTAVGCAVTPGDTPGELVVHPPSWRPDLVEPADLDEEVLRLVGYDTLPSVLPAGAGGRGRTRAQRLRRLVVETLAAGGYAEVPGSPFAPATVAETLGLPPDDERRAALRLANPLSAEEPLLRTTLLPGLLATLRRNVARGHADLALLEVGLVFRGDGARRPPPRPAVTARPGDAELAGLAAALPRQPRHLAVALCGDWQPPGWWGPARPAGWADAVEAARTVAATCHVELGVARGAAAPWHPGRCAELTLSGAVVGYAGELHPQVAEALGVPARTAVMELDLDAVVAAAPPALAAPRLSTFPVATQDVALVVPADVPAGAVAAALRDGAGELLESLRLFDVYAGEQVGPGRRSLAFTLRFRAADRTLTAAETSAARDA
ncbi:MAG: phenylalanine--tRNA ligase subunit beta, partial [Actinomycetota bacterium]